MKTRTLLAATLLLGLALPWGAATAQEGRTIAVTAYLHETSFGFHMVPERIDARVGDTLEVQVTNAAPNVHDLVFCGDAPGGSGPCQDVWAASDRLRENETDTMTVQVTRPGTFEYYCTLPGHKQGGMRGELVVQGEAAKKESPAPAALLAPLAAALVLLALRRRWSP